MTCTAPTHQRLSTAPDADHLSAYMHVGHTADENFYVSYALNKNEQSRSLEKIYIFGILTFNIIQLIN